MRFDEYLLTEDAKTDFYETAAMLGVVATDGLAKKCEDIVYNYKKTDIENITKTFQQVQALAGKSGYDWNSNGVAIIKKIDPFQKSPEVINVFALLIGMYAFRREIVENVMSGRLYFIHNRITDYYDVEKEVFGEIHGAKANTADAIISNVKPHQVFKAMRTEVSEMDDAEQYVGFGKVKIFQCSLKKREKEAQLGKITTFLKKNLGYGIDVADARSIVAEDYDYTEMLNTILTEGVWDKAKGFATNLWKNVTTAIKSVTGKFFRKWSGVFKKKTIPKNYLDRLFLNLGNPQLQEKKMTELTKQQVESIARNPKKIVNLCNKEIHSLGSLITKGGTVYFGAKTMAAKPKFKGDVNSAVFTLISNYCTLIALNDMVTDERDIGSTVNRLVAEMLFGGTKLPLWKIFGDFGDGNTYTHLGTLDTFVSGAKAKAKVEVLGIAVKPQIDYYTITVGMLEHIDETGKRYAVLRTGTNSSSSFTFIFEGTKIVKVALEDSIAKVVTTK